MHQEQAQTPSQRGYIAITTVLVLTVVLVVIGVTVSLLSIGEIQSSLSHKKGEEALDAVEGCVEDVLLRINEDASLPASVTTPEITCSVTINSQVGNNWNVSVAGTLETYTKEIRVSVERDSTITVTSWTEQ